MIQTCWDKGIGRGVRVFITWLWFQLFLPPSKVLVFREFCNGFFLVFIHYGITPHTPIDYEPKVRHAPGLICSCLFQNGFFSWRFRRLVKRHGISFQRISFPKAKITQAPLQFAIAIRFNVFHHPSVTIRAADKKTTQSSCKSDLRPLILLGWLLLGPEHLLFTQYEK